MKSWQTTLIGAIIVLATVFNAVKTGEVINIETLIGALTGAGLFLARDNDKTSENVGAKKSFD